MTHAEFRSASASALIGNALDAYAKRYPQLAALARNARSNDRALRDFARAALRLAAAPGVTVLQVWHLSKLADGWR